MKLKLATFLLLFGVAVLSMAQGRKISVDDFDELIFGLPGRLYLTQGDTEKVEIDCSDDQFDEIEIENRGGRLYIRNRDSNRWGWRGFRGGDITVYVTMKDIRRLDVSGSGDLIGENTFVTGDLDVALSGSGSLSIDVEGDDMAFRISGSGNMEIAGQADEVDAKISGSGKIRADDLRATVLDASISGSGSIYMTVEEEIYSNISGSGNVYYKGDPDRVRSNASGSGKTRRM